MAFVKGWIEVCAGGRRSHTVPIMIARPERISSFVFKAGIKHTYVHSEANTIDDHISVALDEGPMKKGNDNGDEGRFRVRFEGTHMAPFLQ